MTKSPTNEPRDLQERAYMIDDLGGMLASGDTALAVVPSMFKRICGKGDAWLHFKTKFGNEVTYKRTPADFKRFVETPPLEGLGTTLDHLRQLVTLDTEALAIYDELTQRNAGNPTGANQHTSGIFDNIKDSTPPAPTGTSKQRNLRVLRERHPDLYVRVLNDEISSHAAMVEAGEVPPTTSVRLDDIGSIARTLRKHLDATQLDELVRLLTDN